MYKHYHRTLGPLPMNKLLNWTAVGKSTRWKCGNWPWSLSRSDRLASTSGRSAFSTWFRHWLWRLLRVTVKLTNVTREHRSGGNSTCMQHYQSSAFDVILTNFLNKYTKFCKFKMRFVSCMAARNQNKKHPDSKIFRQGTASECNNLNFTFQDWY